MKESHSVYSKLGVYAKLMWSGVILSFTGFSEVGNGKIDVLVYRSAGKIVLGISVYVLSKQRLMYIEKPFMFQELVYFRIYLVEFKTIFT